MKLVTDGKSIYFQTAQGPDLSIFQVPVTGGDVSEFPAPNGRLQDIARDGSEMLFMVQNPQQGGSNVLAKPLPTGPVRMVLKGGSSAIWSPDGQFIFFVRDNPDELDRARADGSDLQRLVKMEGFFSPHLSPDGLRIRFSVANSGAPGGRHGRTQSSPHSRGKRLCLGEPGAWMGKFTFLLAGTARTIQPVGCARPAVMVATRPPNCATVDLRT